MKGYRGRGRCGGETDTQREERWGNGAVGQRGGRKWRPPPTPRTCSLSSQEQKAGRPVPVPVYKGRKDRPCGLETTTSPAPSCRVALRGQSGGGGHTPLGTGLLRGMLPHHQESPLQSWATGLNLGSPTVRTVKSGRDF